MTRKEAKEVLNTYDMSEDNDDTEFKSAIALSIKALEQESVLDKIRAEIERQEKWLWQEAGIKPSNVDIAFSSIKSVLAESEG